MNEHTLISDDQLIGLLKEGNPEAFAIIYKRYARLLYQFAARNIPSHEDCEEIIQDIFESLWVRRDSLRILSLRHYLYNAVRYKVIRYFQHHSVKRKYATHYRFFSEVYEHIEKDDRDPAELIAAIEQLTDQLPERCRVAFRLRLYENLSNTEIAERMNITKKTVEIYMFKAFEHLRNSYSKIFKLT
jgi:RNA polymerase sigma-70 factor (ECF subfamily)